MRACATIAGMLRAIVCLAMSVSAGIAQIPAGSYIVSSFENGNATPGGLFLVDPRNPGPAVAIQGLDPELVGIGISASNGANAVGIDPETEIIYVGEVGPPGTQIDLHEITLNGTMAVPILKTPIGTVSAFAQFGGGISQIHVLPNGDAILVLADLDVSPPLNGAPLAYYSLLTGTVTPINATLNGSTFGQSVTADADNELIYVAMYQGSMQVFEVPFSGGPGTFVGSMGGAPGMAMNSDGLIVSAGSSSIQFMDPATGIVTTGPIVGSNINGLSIEAATDSPVCVLNNLSGPPGVYRVDPSGTVHLLASNYTGVGSGIAVKTNPRTYGAFTPGNETYRWVATPNAGGLPQQGNLSFGIQLNASNGDATGALLFGVGPNSANVLGFQLLVNAALSFPMPTNGSVSLPIPAVTTPIGMRVYFQTLHADPGAPQGIAASDGLVFEIMP